jgi:hypothetical protein
MPYLLCYYLLHIILFLHLLSTNHKCTQACYFPLLLKPTDQKEKMGCYSCGVMECSTVSFLLRVVIVSRDNICVIIILYS